MRVRCFAEIAPVAERHLERDFDGRRTAVGKEHVRQAARRNIDNRARATASAGSCVKPAKMT